MVLDRGIQPSKEECEGTNILMSLSLSPKGQTQPEVRKQGSPQTQSINVSINDKEKEKKGWRVDLERQTVNIQESLITIRNLDVV